MDGVPLQLEDLVSYVRDQRPAGSAVERLASADEAARYLSELADRLISHYVDQARQAGTSWSAISQSVGMTEQAARQRFAETTSDVFREPLRADELTNVFQRATERTLRVLDQAREKARTYGHSSVSPEHILLGLSQEGEGVAAKALESLDISLDAVRQQVEQIIGRGTGAPNGHIPFTAGTKSVLELSSASSWRLGHDYIGTEHLLLGLLWEGKSSAAQLLARLVPEERIIAALKESRPQATQVDRRRAAPPPASPRGSRGQPE